MFVMIQYDEIGTVTERKHGRKHTTERREDRDVMEGRAEERNEG